MASDGNRLSTARSDDRCSVQRIRKSWHWLSVLSRRSHLLASGAKTARSPAEAAASTLSCQLSRRIPANVGGRSGDHRPFAEDRVRRVQANDHPDRRRARNRPGTCARCDLGGRPGSTESMHRRWLRQTPALASSEPGCYVWIRDAEVLWLHVRDPVTAVNRASAKVILRTSSVGAESGTRDWTAWLSSVKASKRRAVGCGTPAPACSRSRETGDSVRHARRGQAPLPPLRCPDRARAAAAVSDRRARVPVLSRPWSGARLLSVGGATRPARVTLRACQSAYH